jgi:hypothetical protein
MTAGEHGSWAIAVRAAVQLARQPSSEHESDLELLGELCDRLPPENDTDYAREAKLLLDRAPATTAL